MKDSIEITFEITEAIKKGLEAGKYIRRGGVIQDQTGKVIVWLREGKQVASEGTKLVKYTATLSKLGKATLAASDFLYMHENFKEIKQQLAAINAKLDAQNISKIKSGFQLCIEAEKMKDKDSAKTQIVAGRQSLEEGANIFYSLYENKKKDDAYNKVKSYDYLKLFVIAELAIIKSYFWSDENELAKDRLTRLKEIVLYDTARHMKINKHGLMKNIVADAILVPLYFLSSLFSKDELEKLLDEIEKTDKTETVINKILELEKDRKALLYDGPVNDLLLVKESLDSYLIELDQPKETLKRLSISEY